MPMPLQLIRAGSYYLGKTGNVRQVTSKGYASLAWRDAHHSMWWGVDYPCEIFANWADREVPKP